MVGILASYEHHFIRVHDNLVQHPSNTRSILSSLRRGNVNLYHLVQNSILSSIADNAHLIPLPLFGCGWGMSTNPLKSKLGRLTLPFFHSIPVIYPSFDIIKKC